MNRCIRENVSNYDRFILISYQVNVTLVGQNNETYSRSWPVNDNSRLPFDQ